LLRLSLAKAQGTSEAKVAEKWNRLGMKGTVHLHSLRRLPGFLVLACSLTAQIQAQTSADMARHAVSYIEVMPSARAAMVVALKQYRDASRQEAGHVRIDLLEQVGRPGHFAIVEHWRDQQAFDAHGMAPHVKTFRDALQSIRLSDYDQRPYKPLTVGSGTAAGNTQAIYVVTHVDTVGGGQADAPGVLTRLAEASRKEQGCLRFDVVQHTMRANHFTIIEVWQNQRRLDAHAAAVHTRQYRDVLQPISGSPLDERLFTAIE
jgi:quinol monooxygenase YgiN